MGFKDIALADSVVIAGGKELVLVGNAVSSIPDASFPDETSKLLKDSSNGGRVSVTEGTFTLGTHGADSPSVGWIDLQWALAKRGRPSLDDKPLIRTTIMLTEEDKEKLKVLGGSSWIRNQIRMARIGEIQ